MGYTDIDISCNPSSPCSQSSVKHQSIYTYHLTIRMATPSQLIADIDYPSYETIYKLANELKYDFYELAILLELNIGDYDPSSFTKFKVGCVTEMLRRWAAVRGRGWVDQLNLALYNMGRNDIRERLNEFVQNLSEDKTKAAVSMHLFGTSNLDVESPLMFSERTDYLWLVASNILCEWQELALNLDIQYYEIVECRSKIQETTGHCYFQKCLKVLQDWKNNKTTSPNHLYTCLIRMNRPALTKLLE